MAGLTDGVTCDGFMGITMVLIPSQRHMLVAIVDATDGPTHGGVGKEKDTLPWSILNALRTTHGLLDAQKAAGADRTLWSKKYIGGNLLSHRKTRQREIPHTLRCGEAGRIVELSKRMLINLYHGSELDSVRIRLLHGGGSHGFGTATISAPTMLP